MQKVFHFDSPREQYRCDTAVVCCFDHRFRQVFTKFLKRTGVERFDAVIVAGGAKNLASPANEADRAFVLEQLRISIRLHSTRQIILMVHSDCGAYGGLDAFAGNRADEAQHHEAELRRAAEWLESRLPDIEIQAYFVDFEGMWRVQLAEKPLAASLPG